jgi:hypothetical protein
MNGSSFVMPKQQEVTLTLSAKLTITDGRVKAADMAEFCEQLSGFFVEEWDLSEFYVDHPDGESDGLNLQLDVVHVEVNN